MRLHIIAACTDRKRGVARVRLAEIPHGPSRAERWRARLEKFRECRVAAEDLYVGNHWSAALTLKVAATAAGWTRSALWVASAGYGLVESSEPVVPYGATFGSGHPDSVVDPHAPDSTESQTRAWWDELTARRGIHTLAARDHDAAILFVASRPYVDAAADDLMRAASKLSRPERLVIVTGESPRERGLEPHVVIPSARVRTVVGGPLTALHARTAHKLVSQTRPDSWSASAARTLVSHLAASAPEVPRPERQTLSDKQVAAFVRKAVASDASLSASRALRLLREGGNACEQKRFKALFHENRRAS